MTAVRSLSLLQQRIVSALLRNNLPPKSTAQHISRLSYSDKRVVTSGFGNDGADGGGGGGG